MTAGGEIADNIMIGIVVIVLLEGLLSPIATIVAAWRGGRVENDDDDLDETEE